jgi:hypothetical protein
MLQSGAPIVEQLPAVEHHEARKMISDEVDEKLRGMKRKIDALKSGRKLTPAQIRESMDLLFQHYDFSPIEELIKMAIGTEEERTKKDICMFLTEFMVPKLKSVEISGQVDHTHTVVIRRYGENGKITDQPLPRAPGFPILAPSRDIEAVVEREATDE